MSNSEKHRQDTQHAFLVAWGWFVEHLGLIQHLQAVSLKQKPYHHRPQTKVLAFLVAILVAHPLEKDQAVVSPHRVECSMRGYLGGLPSLW